MANNWRNHQQPSLNALISWMNQHGITQSQVVSIFKDEYSGQWEVIYYEA